MRLFQVLNNTVNIVSDDRIYVDTIKNYISDGGELSIDDLQIFCAVHDDQQKYCEVNNVRYEYPVEFFDNIINNIAMLISNKAKRSYSPPTPEEIQAALTQAVQSHLDSKAQERNYDNIHTACTYINSSDPVFASEASALLLWRDKVWRECYSILDDVKSGRSPIPSVSELLAELPSFSWPDEVTTEEQ